MAQKEIGTAYNNNFGSFALAGFLADTVSWSKEFGNTDIVFTIEGDTDSKLYQDPKDRIRMELFILVAGGDITPPEPGDTIALTDPDGASVSYGVETAEVSFTRTRTKLSLEVVKEVGITYV